MDIFEIISIGIGLSMDAAAVSMTNGMCHKTHGRLKMALMPVFFGVFQGIMPLLGFFAGSVFARFISRYAGIAVLVILGFIGVRMLNEGLKSVKEYASAPAPLTYGSLTLQAVATSIDAFAVGIGMSAVGADIVVSSSIIAATTLIVTAAAAVIGTKFGDMLGKKAEILGGIILIVIAVKAAF